MKALRIVNVKGEYHLELVDGAGSMRLAKFRTPMAMSMFCAIARTGIKLAEEQ